MEPHRPRWIEIGFTVRERPHLKHVLDGIEGFAKQRPNWRLRLKNYFQLTPIAALGGQTHGLIGGIPNPGLEARMRKRSLPTVLINAPGEPEWASNVRLDYAELGEQAVGHFMGQSIRDIGWFGSPHPERTEHHRYLEGVRASAKRYGVSLHEFSELPPDNDWLDMDAQLDQWVRWLRSLPRGTGIICADDEFAARLYLAASRTRRTIGRDWFLLGLGNEKHFCEACSPPLSSIQIRYFEMGWEAAVLMDELLDSRKPRYRTTIVRDHILIARQSSRRSGSLNDKGERALAFIWDNVRSGVTVDQVARHVGVQPRQLHRLIQERSGTSPSAEIQRARVETAKRVLIESTVSLADVAAECGFADQAHMSRAIKKATGMTPSRFRRIR